MKQHIDFTYLCQPPKRYTFEHPRLKTWVEGWCKGKVLNLFAGMIKLRVDEYRVDLDPLAPADHHGEAYEFVSTTSMRFDTVILDTPYNLRKSREKYGSRYMGSFTKIKEKIPDILNEAGRVIILGYDTVGMAHRRDFKKLAICVVCHNGDHNDILCTVEQQINHTLKSVLEVEDDIIMDAFNTSA